MAQLLGALLRDDAAHLVEHRVRDGVDVALQPQRADAVAQRVGLLAQLRDELAMLGRERLAAAPW